MSTTLPSRKPPLQQRSSRKLSEDDLYPYSDGEPMAESELHAGEMTYALSSIDLWLENRPDAHVSLDTFLYYQEGNPSAVVSPDLYVVFGSDKRLRESYRVWQEGGRLPSFVLEITSKSTRRADIAPRPNEIPRPNGRRRPVKNKYRIYEQVLGVAEYFLFDPTSDYLSPPLQGFRLADGRYVPIAAETEPLPNLPPQQQPARWLYSEQLGLALSHEGMHLRFYDPVSGQPLLRTAEAVHLAQTERRRADAEWQRAEAEVLARAAADRRAEAEADVRASVEAENARLRAELEALRKAQGL